MVIQRSLNDYEIGLKLYCMNRIMKFANKSVAQHIKFVLMTKKSVVETFHLHMFSEKKKKKFTLLLLLFLSNFNLGITPSNMRNYIE